MSAMTEQRLNEIEKKYIVLMMVGCAGGVEGELIAEVRRLHERIKSAPHESNCIVMTGKDADIRLYGCTCWKRQALGEQ